VVDLSAVEPAEAVTAGAPTCWQCSWVHRAGVWVLKSRNRLCSAHGAILSAGDVARLAGLDAAEHAS
jgi:hypothetical protein